MLVPVPERLRQRGDAPGSPVPAVPAATIAVVREGEAGLETFFLLRQRSMAFAAGMCVFPGGGVHADDAAPLPWAGPDARHFAARFGCDPDLAHALVVAAARETFEETGVLLAGPDERSVVDDTTPFHDARLQLERHEYSFASFLERNGLVLRADLLGPWSHWITPRFEPRRYDTRFFVAVLPEHQRIDSVSTEAEHSFWAPLSGILGRVDRGEVAMLAPTSSTCRDLAAETADSVLRAAAIRRIRPIEPRIVEVDGELWLETGEEEPA